MSGLGLALDISFSSRAVATESTPATIFGASLLAWWDASVAGSFTLSGLDVTSWADISGNGLTADQSTVSKKPTYSATALSSKPGVTFDGVDDYLAMSSVASFPTGTNACTLIAIAKMVTVDFYPQLVNYGKSTAYKTRGLAGVNTNGNVGISWNSDDQEVATAWNVQRLVIGQFSGSTCELSIDGGANTTKTSTGSPSIDASGNAGTIGGPLSLSTTGAGNYILQELLVVSGTVTAGQIAAMQAYRLSKW